MNLDDISYAVIGAAMKVHRSLGPGLLESAYETCLAYELQKQGFEVQRQEPIPVVYDEVRLDCGFRADLLVNRQFIVECKAKDKLHPIDLAQLLSHLRLMKLQLGLLINFHETNLQAGIKRVVNNYQKS